MGENIPTIPEVFKGKNIFLTGGSGFIGKVLLEKLLRSCPDLDTIYLLLRPKKGKTEEERVRAITDLGLFDVLRKKNPSSFSKIKIISGDVSKLGLAISPSDRQKLIKNVHIFIHGAASVRFDESLSRAVILNTRGTREACQLALEMKQIILFYHISTTYCLASDRYLVEEKLYPPITDWRKTIKIAEECDERVVDVLTQKYMGTLPNTYTFSKNLAEHVVNDMLGGKVPVVIGRPSIVVATFEDPVAGWTDNFNGPSGILIASAKGVLRCLYANPDQAADNVPVDIVVKIIIISIWHHLVLMPPDKRLTVNVYNAANSNVKPVSFGEMTEYTKSFNWVHPIGNAAWYPDGVITKCWYYFYLRFVLFQLLPSSMVDGILKMAGHKPILVDVQRKIYSALQALNYFIINQWNFVNEKAWNLGHALRPSDEKDFGFDEERVDIYEFMRNAAIGCKKYLLKEDSEETEKARTHIRRLFGIYVAYNIIWYGALLWFFLYKLDVPSILLRKFNETFLFFTTGH